MFEKEAEEYFETECLHRHAGTEEQLKEDVVPAFQKGAEFGYNKAKEELEKDNNRLFLEGAKRVEELETQIEKLIDFVLSKTDCCDVCPITDTCINSEGTCPYAGILAKGEEEVTREWIMQFISKEIKENESK